MKIDYHSVEMSIFCGPRFFNKLQEFCDKLYLYDEKIKRVQCYSSFFEPNKNYPFKDSDFAYYPLTLIYSRKKWKTLWICWPRSVLLENVKKNSPGVFSPFLLSTDDFEISICENVPQSFVEYIADMNLCYFKNSNYCKPVHGLSSFEHAGEVSQSFLDSLSDQISEILYTLSGYKLSKWDIEPNYSVNGKYSYIPVETKTVDGVHYRSFVLKDFNAISRTIVVAWTGDYDTFDYINSDEVKFSLSDYKVNPGDLTIAESVDFIRHQESHGLYSYPDIVINCKFFRKISEELKMKIFEFVEQYVAEWNRREGSKIHYCDLVDSDSEYSVSVHVDFGDCDPVAVIQLLKLLEKSDLKIDDVSI